MSWCRRYTCDINRKDSNDKIEEIKESLRLDLYNAASE